MSALRSLPYLFAQETRGKVFKAAAGTDYGFYEKDGLIVVEKGPIHRQELVRFKRQGEKGKELRLLDILGLDSI